MKLESDALIEEALCEFIKLRDHELFKSLHDKLMEELSKHRETNHSGKEFFDPENIQIYYKRVENLISHEIQNADEFDERCVLQDERVYTPAKMTPFDKQRLVNRKFDQNPSRRMLSFNLNESAGISIKTSLNDFKIEKRVLSSPYTPRSILGNNRRAPQETPMTTAMEMYNWLQDYKNQGKGRSNLLEKIQYLREEPTLREHIMEKAEKLIEKVQENFRISDSKQILNFYCLFSFDNFRVLEKMISIESKKTEGNYIHEILLNEIFHKSLLAICIETISFIMNFSNLCLEKLLEYCEIEAFDFWKNIASFLKFDCNMPIPVKEYFLVLERKIVFHLAWSKNSHIHKIVEESNFSEKENALMYQEEIFFKRLLCHAAFQLNKICDDLKLNHNISEMVWKIVKHIISNEPDLILERHMDQLIICSIYGVGKVMRLTLKFKEIFTKYKELLKDNALVEELISKVTMDNPDESSDIITFYNSIYLSKVKNLLNSLKNGDFSNINNSSALSKIQIMLTPLRESVKIYSPYKNRMTPNTIKLCAIGEFSQSPAKKYSQFLQANTQNSNRKLQFDDQKTSKTSSLFNKLKRIDSSNEGTTDLPGKSSIKTFLDIEKEPKSPEFKKEDQSS